MINRAEALQIEMVHTDHDLTRFQSDQRDSDHYLQQQALHHNHHGISRSFVASDDGCSVLGFYALTTASVQFENCDETALRRLPHYPVTAALISHLAVDRQSPRPLAETLLVDALRRIVDVEHELAIRVILVSAPDNAAIAFYLRFGFIRLSGHSDRLFLPLATAKQALRP